LIKLHLVHAVTTNETRELLSKSVDDVSQEIKSIKSAISALADDSQKVDANSRQLDDILNILLPIQDMSDGISEVTKKFQRWDLKQQSTCVYK